jgi:hypothetical protein
MDFDDQRVYSAKSCQYGIQTNTRSIILTESALGKPDLSLTKQRVRALGFFHSKLESKVEDVGSTHRGPLFPIFAMFLRHFGHRRGVVRIYPG